MSTDVSYWFSTLLVFGTYRLPGGEPARRVGLIDRPVPGDLVG